IKWIFVGYAEHSKAFRFCVIEPKDSVSINSIIESRDAIFDENRFSLVHTPSLRISNGTEDIGGSVVPKEKEAINDEMDSIMGNNTWVLADLPLGIDYFDTYAPVASISTIRLLIAMASIHNLIIHQMDVKIAFLNGDLYGDVYMNQPQSFIMHGNENNVDLTKEFLSSKFFMKGIEEADVILDDANNGQVVSQLEYSMVIGCLMYAVTGTRLDIAFVVGKLSSNTEDNLSTSGWVILLGGGVISWASKKQTCITDSTIASEFVALAATGKEAEWLRNLILEIPLESKPIAPISIRYDSDATLAKAYS
nr:hypothetical protein [Tanacetum cinerariifolium]